MSISAVGSYSSALTLPSPSAASSGPQRTLQTDPGPAVSISFSSIHPPIGSFTFKIDGENDGTTIADAGEEYAATIPGLGTVNGPNEAAVDAAINFRISELA